MKNLVECWVYQFPNPGCALTGIVKEVCWIEYIAAAFCAHVALGPWNHYARQKGESLIQNGKRLSPIFF